MKKIQLILSIGFLFFSSLVLADIIDETADKSMIQDEFDTYVNGDTILVKSKTKIKNINHKGDPLTMCTETESFKQREAPALLAQQELEEAKVAAGDGYDTQDSSGISHGLEKMGD